MSTKTYAFDISEPFHYRDHRGSLEESLKTERMLTFTELLKHLARNFGAGAATFGPPVRDERIARTTCVVIYQGNAVGFATVEKDSI